jgi:hypothetical protein
MLIQNIPIMTDFTFDHKASLWLSAYAEDRSLVFAQIAFLKTVNWSRFAGGWFDRWSESIIEIEAKAVLLIDILHVLLQNV